MSKTCLPMIASDGLQHPRHAQAQGISRAEPLASLFEHDLRPNELNVRKGSWLCENAKTLDRDRTSYSFNAAMAAQTASPFNFEVELKNIILAALRVFEFSHSLGPYRRLGRIPGRTSHELGPLNSLHSRRHRRRVPGRRRRLFGDLAGRFRVKPPSPIIPNVHVRESRRELFPRHSRLQLFPRRLELGLGGVEVGG